MKFGAYVAAAQLANEAASASDLEAADLTSKAAVARTKADHDRLAAITANTSAVTALAALGGYAADITKSVQYTINGGSLVISPLVTLDTELVGGGSEPESADPKPGG